jgi:Tannase and feruloyl esterase
VNDRIGVDVWMPVNGWNGRFQGVGGGAFLAGHPYFMVGAVNAGYSAAVTDAGNTPSSPFDGSFALDSTGHLNWPLIKDFAYRGVHDLAVVGKAVTAAYYGSKAKFSYWNGCSTGGRQGMAEAQRYPSDFDGILAGAPAINWQKYLPGSLWAQLVMLQSVDFMPQCKFSAFQTAAIKACDTLGDRVVDGVIGDPLACRFDPDSLVGTSTPCGTITAQDAAVVAKIVAGPRSTGGKFLWYGLPWGATFAGDFVGAGLANTATTGGTTIGVPFPLILEYLGTWVQQNPPVPAGTWDWTTTTYDRFDQLFQQSVDLFGNVMGTDNPDLSGFKKAGGKLVIYHGLADQLIFPQGTINYYRRVQQSTGDRTDTADFARLFLAPGLAHCAGGPGAQPDNPLNQLVDWVENGKAPKSLDGVIRDPSTGAVIATRPICIYPKVAVYNGSGPTTQASSFACRHNR